MQHLIRYGLILTGICLLGLLPATAQKAGDSSSIIHILHADTLNTINKDSVQIARFIGNAAFRQGTTTFYSDSAFKNNRTNQLDAYGHVHINQADSVQVYGNYLHYEGNTRMATLQGNARLTDGKVTITGPELQYDMGARIGTYTKGGKLVNGQSVLTSDEGFYYADTKDVYFKKNVLLVDPEYTLTTDTLLYNTETKIATIVAPTTINDGKTVMYTTSGYYNTETGFGNFGNRPTIEDSTGTLTADNIETDKQTGFAYATGNMVYRDTAQKMSLLSNYGMVNQTNKTVLATQHPLLILERNTDTLYLTADTLFSGILGNDSITAPPIRRDSATDTAAAIPAPGRDSTALPRDTTAPAAADTVFALALDKAAGDTATKPADTTRELTDNAALAKAIDTARAVTDTAAITRPQQQPPPPPGPAADTAARPQLAAATDTTRKDTTAKRYILAYHHVRIFSDSLQGVADSLYYSTLDSAFRFYYNPVLWANDTQLSGDTIVLFTKNQQADKMLLQPNALIVNEAGRELYNQIKGNIITGYFNGNALDWMNVDGNAESIYYIKDEDSAFISVNRSLSAIIHIHFKEGELNKVNFIKDPEGTMYPFTQRPRDQMLLENFHWDIKRRPRSKYELMGGIRSKE